MSACTGYLRRLSDSFGQAWNNFWFAPSDAVTLCVIRLLTGVFAVYWYLCFAPDLEWFFGPNGLLPVSDMASWRQGRGFSYLDYISDPLTLKVVYWAGLLVLLCFALGFYTRIASVLSLIIIWSFIQRAPMLAGNTEEILAMLMAYLWIGPAGKCLSIDAWLAGRKSAERPLTSQDETALSRSATISLRLIQIHTTAIYILMAIAQLRGDVWWNGTAAGWLARSSALFDISTWPIFAINALTHFVLASELVFAVLIWNRLTRPLMLSLAAILWTILAILTSQFDFCYLMLVASLSFVAPEWWRICCRTEAADRKE